MCSNTKAFLHQHRVEVILFSVSMLDIPVLWINKPAQLPEYHTNTFLVYPKTLGDN